MQLREYLRKFVDKLFPGRAHRRMLALKKAQEYDPWSIELDDDDDDEPYWYYEDPEDEYYDPEDC